jgi:leader peptidase (prepilin peptidase)/N-methyltransferase
MPSAYFLSYFVLISALIITIRSDLETMLISRYVTLFLVPFGFLFSALGLLPITLTESITGCLVGFGGLFLIAYTFWYFTGKHGLGQGDIDLLALIGTFTGIVGCWATILIGSVTGSILGIVYMRNTRSTEPVKIPFGPFLALGAIVYVFWQESITQMLLGL